jgi:hypothetical protein
MRRQEKTSYLFCEQSRRKTTTSLKLLHDDAMKGTCLSWESNAGQRVRNSIGRAQFIEETHKKADY